MSTLLQYMKSTDPEIVATVERRKTAYRAWEENVFDWAAKITGLPRDEIVVGIHGWRNDRLTVLGLKPYQVNAAELPGQWTKDPVRPYKSNPAFEDFAKIATYEAEEVPGRPNIAWGDGLFGAGGLFAHEGVAYSGFGFIPTGKHQKDSGEGWEEIRASEYMAAQEAVNDARKSREEP